MSQGGEGLKVKTKISITNPGMPMEEKCSLSISVSDLRNEAEAKDVLRKLLPPLAKVSGQAVLAEVE